MTRGRKLKANSLTASFVAHTREMRESIAWAHLPDNARRVLDRLELEHMRHGGAENGSLPCTYADFEKAGIRRASVALAIRQCVALGFLEVTSKGYRGGGDIRKPSLYRLTYVVGCGKSSAPTDEWRRLRSDEVADGALTRVRGNSRGTRAKNHFSGREIAPLPDAPARLQRTPAWARKRVSSPRRENEPPIYISGRDDG